MATQRTLLILPARNEAASLPSLLAELRRQYPRYDVLVVNDGSTDGTTQVAQGQGVRVVELPFNLGLGGAEQTGFMYAERCGYDIVVRLDADGQHPPEEVETLLRALQETGADMVIGSRFLHDRGFRSTGLRRLGIRWLALLNTLLTGQRITDSTSGFRAYRREALEFLAGCNPQGYPEAESVVLLVRNGFRIAEVPVAMRARALGESSIGAAHAAYYMLRTTLAVCIAAMRKRTRLVEPDHG